MEGRKLMLLWLPLKASTAHSEHTNTFQLLVLLIIFVFLVSVCFYFFLHLLPLGQLDHHPTEIVPHACGYFSNRTFKHLHTRICCIMLFAILVLMVAFGLHVKYSPRCIYQLMLIFKIIT